MPNTEGPPTKPFRRSVLLLAAALPLALAAATALTSVRIGYPMLGWGLLALGGTVALVNFYLSVVRDYLHRKRRPKQQYRHVSGVPFFGLAVVPGLYLVPHQPWLTFVVMLLMLIDTAGMHWFAYAVWSDSRWP